MRFPFTISAIFITFLGVSFATPVAARGWLEQQDSGPTLDDLKMISSSTGYAVGDGGVILKTTDGITWSSVGKAAFASYDFNAVDAIGETTFVVGLNHIVRSTNGGVSWNDVSPAGLTLDGSAYLYGVDFVNSSIGFVVGGKNSDGFVLRTTDGGASWTDFIGELPAGTGTLWDIACVNAAICYAVGDGGVIVKTTTGGSSWLAQDSGTTASLRGVSALSNTTVWAVGAFGVIKKTTDGSTWTNLASPVKSTLFEVEFSSSSYGIIVGSSGVAYVTEDSGASWQARTLPDGATTTLLGLDMVGANTGWATGFGGVIYRFDGLGPTVGAVTPATATVGISQNYTVSYNDSGGVGVSQCRLYYYADEFEPMTLSSPGGTSGTASGTHLFASGGTRQLRAFCDDLAGNSGSGAVSVITVGSSNRAPAPPANLTQHDSPSGPAETVGFTFADTTITFKGLLSDPDNDPVRLYIEFRPVGIDFSNVAIGGSGDVASGSVASMNFGGWPAGSYHWQAKASDGEDSSAWAPFGGNAEAAADFIISSAATPPEIPVEEPAADAPATGEPATPVGLLPAGFAIGNLVKLADDGNPNTFGDSAVFYLGADGGRYVFPNDKAYFSWYSDFSPIRIISIADLAAIPLRGNVTYRPGVKMVKLQTSPVVYVMTARGVLRAVPSEAIAAALYGSNWNREIEDINDAFWTNYSVGAPLAVVGDFNRTAVREAATTISTDRGLVSP